MAYQRFTFQVAHLARPDDPARIVLGGQQTLEELHSAIQQAFHFDFDHLYSFFMSGRAWDSSSEYAAVPRRGSGEKSTRNARLDRLGLHVGATFLYLFDYGDEHHFDIRLEDIATSDRAIPSVQFERVPTNPPAQYKIYADDEDDEDEVSAVVLPLELIGVPGHLPSSADSELGYNWGGDGSDSHQPVRAHVEAALIPTDGNYPSPLDQLLHLGEITGDNPVATRIAALGLTQEHVPDLVRMARDRALNTASGDSDEVWGPAYAIEALKYLDISAFVTELITLLDVDDDWLAEGVPDVLGRAGAAALEPLRHYLFDRSRWMHGRAGAAHAIALVAEHYPELRNQVVRILSDQLEQATEHDTVFNGFVLADMLTLKAVEALPVIRKAFEQDAVAASITGDWTEVLKGLGETVDPADPLVLRSRQHWDAERASMWPFAIPEITSPRVAVPSSAPSPKHKQQKNKRKMAQASRKANRSKKKHK